MKPLPDRWRFLLPAVVLFAADVTFTLLGQPDTYHSGFYAAAVEMNPLAHRIMLFGPGWFVAAACGWGLVFATVILFRRHRLGAWLGVVLAVGHAVGGATWVVWFAGWVPAVAYLAGAAFACGRVWPKRVV